MSIKISLAIACVISLLWIEFADRYLGNRTKIILIIISSVLALISYIKNMHREHKGTSIKKHVDDYSVVDLETTGVFVGSADIIEISALKVRDNKVVDKFSTLVNPHYHIPEEATAVNHITDEMVADAPDISDVLGVFLNFVGTDVIVGYNNAAFDMNIIYDKSLEIIGFPFTNDYIDLLHSARRCLVELDNHRLETVSKHYNLDTEGEHRALKDCCSDLARMAGN